MDECVAVAVAEAVAVAVTEAVAEADQSIHDPSIRAVSQMVPNGPKWSQVVPRGPQKSPKNAKMVEMGSHPTVLSDSRTKNDGRRARNVMGPLQTPKKPVKK